MYSRLYYWLALSTVEESLDSKLCDRVLGDNADEKIEEQVQWPKWDLMFNPTRCWTWEMLGMCYKARSLDLTAHALLPEWKGFQQQV